MKRCPSCKNVLEPEAKHCPSCGAAVRVQTQDNDYLKKDKWSFTGVAGALDRNEVSASKRAEERPQFAKTMMVTGKEATQARGLTSEKGDSVSRFDKTVAMSALDPRSVKKPKVEDEIAEDETILGVPKMDDPSRTVPFQLGSASSTKVRISKDDEEFKDRPNLTVPIPLKEGTSTKARISKDPGGERPINLTAPLPLSKGVATQAKVSKEHVGDDRGMAVKTAPFEPQVLVKSKSNELKATAPFEIATPVKRQERAKSGPVEVQGNKTQARFSSDEKGRWRRILAAIASVILIATWFVPNIWIIPPVFPMDLLGVVKGLSLVALVTPPFVGAIVLTLIIAPIDPKLRASIILVLGFCALAFPLLLGAPSLPLNGYISFAIVLAATLATVVIQTQTSTALIGNLSLSLLPATFLGVAIFGVLTSRLPIANIAVFKDPINVYAGMLLIAVSAEELLSKYRE